VPAPGQDCTITLQHPAVNAGQPAGFFIKPDAWSERLPRLYFPGITVAGIAGVTSPLQPGKLVFEGVVLCRASQITRSGTLDPRSGQAIYDRLREYAARINQPLTLVSPAGVTYTVGFEAFDARWSPLGGPWLLEWEVRCVWVEV
jgi:hypothetical protein